MNDSRFSLCLTYPNIKEPSQKIMFRVADIIDDCLVQAQYSNPALGENDMYKPRSLKFRSSEGVLNRAEIRRWNINEQGSIFPSSSHTAKFYEIVFPVEFSDINLTNKSAIRKVFKDGFELFDGISENLLLIIGEEDEFYIGLECQPKDFIISNNCYRINPSCSDMLHTTHYFFERRIKKSDIITTEKADIFIEKGKKVHNRYFYKYLSLTEPEEIFHLRDFQEYIPVFINKYIKQQKDKKGYSDNEIKKIVSIIEESLNDELELTQFFELAGYSIEDVTNQISRYEEEIINAFLSNDIATQIIEKYVLNSEEVYNICLNVVKNQWLMEKDTERESLNIELFKKDEELQELCNSITKSKKAQKAHELSLCQVNFGNFFEKGSVK